MTQTPSIDGNPSAKSSAGKQRFSAVALVILGLGGIWLFAPKPKTPPSVTILPPDHSIPAPPMPLPDRWIPITPGWGWLWHLRYAVLGKPIAVTIQTEVIRFGAADDSPLSGVIGQRAPLVSSNGVSAWILPKGEIESFVASLQPRARVVIRGSRAIIGQNSLANMSMTSSPQIDGKTVAIGDFQTYAVRKLGNGLELSAGFVSSELVTNTVPDSSSGREVIQLRTNLTLAAIMQIPRGHGVFLFDTNRARPDSRGMALVVRPKVN